MSTALVLSEAGRRQDGRWKRGSTDITESGNNARQWSQRMTECGTILDFAPDLAGQVVNGDLALDAAYRDATGRRDAERHRLEEQDTGGPTA